MKEEPWLPTLMAILATLAFLVPSWWIFVSAFRIEGAIFRYISPLEVQFWMPVPPSAQNVIALLFESDFDRALLNSAIITAVTVALGLAVSSTAAFGLSAFNFRGRGLVFSVVVVSFLVPFQAIAVPLSAKFRSWGLAETYTGLVLPGIANGMVVFLLRQFFLGIPAELSEAARVDGASWFRIYRSIFLPLAKPALVASGLLLGVFQWHAYLWPLLIATTPEMRVAPVAIASLAGQFEVSYGQMFAASLVTSFIPAVFLLRYQRVFTSSIAATGTKE